MNIDIQQAATPELTAETTEFESLDLHKACRLGDLNSIEQAILAFPEKLDEKDLSVIYKQLGWAPLYRTVICGYYDGAKLLLSNNANPDIANNLGETCLHQAADNSQYKIAELLLEYNANPNMQQNDGDTPLHHAAFRGDSKMCELLLKYKADPNIPNHVFGRTPLHYAVDCGNLDAVRVMLEYNGDPLIRDKVIYNQQNKSAYDLSRDAEIHNLIVQMYDKNGLTEQGKENLSPLSDLMAYEISEYTEREHYFQSPHHHSSRDFDTFGRHAMKQLLSSPKAQLHLPNYEKSPSSLKPIYDWLEKINLQDLYEVMVESGYDDVQAMIHQMSSPIPITESSFEKIGISSPGHRYRLIMKLEEEAGIFQRLYNQSSKPNPLKVCVRPGHATSAWSSVKLRDWLAGLRLEELYENFLISGFDDYEWLVRQMHWRKPVTEEMLEKEVRILKPGYRNRILSKLHEDANRTGMMMDSGSSCVACNLCVVFQ